MGKEVSPLTKTSWKFVLQEAKLRYFILTTKRTNSTTAFITFTAVHHNALRDLFKIFFWVLWKDKTNISLRWKHAANANGCRPNIQPMFPEIYIKSVITNTKPSVFWQCTANFLFPAALFVELINNSVCQKNRGCLNKFFSLCPPGMTMKHQYTHTDVPKV